MFSRRSIFRLMGASSATAVVAALPSRQAVPMPVWTTEGPIQADRVGGLTTFVDVDLGFWEGHQWTAEQALRFKALAQ